MTDAPPHSARTRIPLLVAGMLLVAVNLRPSLASVGPLVDPIRDSTGMSATAFGFLTTLPLIAFGVVSILAPRVTRRIGLGGALVLALSLIVVGTAARPLSGAALLLAGTAVLGTGIALGNVLLPALVKRDFGAHSGRMTSLYSSVMGIGATVAAAIAVPLAGRIGWRGSMAVWAVPAAIALLVWLPRARESRPAPQPETGVLSTSRSLGRSALAWQVALFMGFQSLTFYVILAWLPELLQSRGLGPAAAGWLLALSQATGIAGSAIIPLLAVRRRDQTPIVLALGALEACALLGLLPSGAGTLAAVCVGVLGFVMGGTFSLALLFLVLRAPDTRMATGLSGMAQSAGYLVAAIGPTLVGLIRDATGNWTGPLVCLMAALVLKIASGMGAARDRVVAG